MDLSLFSEACSKLSLAELKIPEEYIMVGSSISLKKSLPKS